MAIEDTPAFKDAVAKAVAAATAEILGKMQTAGPAKSDDASFARTLALEIARIADQGTNRKRVAPEEMERREGGREEMENFIIKYRSEGVMPEYELIAPIYFEERLVAHTYVGTDHVLRKTKIGWPGMPNDSMRPVNKPAEDIFNALMVWTGGTPKVKHDGIREKDASRALKVLHEPSVPQPDQVGGRARGGDLQILGRNQPGEVVETRVLGTVAAPARQLA